MEVNGQLYTLATLPQENGIGGCVGPRARGLCEYWHIIEIIITTYIK
jgi:hypothetical protein